MVKVSIIPTLSSIWIIVTFLRIDNRTVKANINNPSNNRPKLVNSSEENRSINSLMIDEERANHIVTTLCKTRSSLLDTIYAKSKSTYSNLYDNPTAGVRLQAISIEKTNRTSDVYNPRIDRRSINVPYPIKYDKNGFSQRLPITKIEVAKSAESDAAFNRDEEEQKIERDIENVDVEILKKEFSFAFWDKNLTNRDKVSSLFDNYIVVKSRRCLLEFDDKTAKLTLADFDGPSISQDVESLMDEGSIGSEHIRVKRDLSDSDSLDEIRVEKDFTARFKDGYKSENRNDFEPKISMGRKRLDHETGFPNAQPEVRSSIGGGDTGAENSDDKLKRRKKSDVSQSEFARVSRDGRKKSRHKSRKHKHRKRPKSHRHDKKMAKYRKESGNDGKRNEDNKLIETTAKLKDKPRDISAAVVADDLQVESRVEKRDSGDAKSEIEVKKKREVSKGGEIELALKSSERTLTAKVDPSSLRKERKDLGEDLLRVKRHERAGSFESDKALNRAAFCRRGRRADDLKYYDEIYESDRVQRDGIKPRIADRVGKKTRREKAAKSVDEIKDLMGKLIGKVNELDSYVRTKGKGEIKRKKKRAEEEVPSNLTRCVNADLKNIKKSEDSRSWVDKTDGGFKSKLVSEKSGKLADDRRIGEINSQDRKRFSGTTKRNGGDSDKSRKKRKPHRKWDRWTDWSSCSVTCGKGRQIRWRHCVHDCTLAETEMEEKTCQLPACGPGKFLGIF